MFYFDKDRQEVREWIAAAVKATEKKFFERIFALNNEIDRLKETNADLLREIENLKSQVAEIKIDTQDTPESLFYLPKPKDAYITKDRAEILERLQRAANLDELKNFLDGSDTEAGKKFRRLLDSHLNGVNSFLEKFSAEKIDDDELSETVTAKYFKLFKHVFFDNILVATSRGVREGNVFYFEFLDRVNDYLRGCGIYTVNAKSGVKVTDEDYQNMTPQIRKTDDKNLSETIAEIERLPYRINYLNEFDEQKYLQYNGVMTVYKAV